MDHFQADFFDAKAGYGEIAWMSFGTSLVAKNKYKSKKTIYRRTSDKVGGHAIDSVLPYEEASKHLTYDFRKKMVDICRNLDIDPSHLMACIAFETGYTFSPNVACVGSTATGLIQFMKSTAQNLGTNIIHLFSLSAADQLIYVEIYFMPYKGKLKTVEDVYAAIHWPAAIGKAEHFVIYKNNINKEKDPYDSNKGLDKNNNNQVTKKEMVATVKKLLLEGKDYAG